jgi:hypothetical protein
MDDEDESDEDEEDDEDDIEEYSWNKKRNSSNYKSTRS